VTRCALLCQRSNQFLSGEECCWVSILNYG
jgi:hypothetical protein